MDWEQQYSFCFCLLFLTLLPFLTTGQTSKNFSLGSSLTALDDDSSYKESPSGDFAFGFRQIKPDGFLLAVWFNKIPERTIVWSANGANLAPKGSKIELTSDGLFQLNDPNGKEIWNAESSSIVVDHAAMLDTGNFVLANQDSVYLWESFGQPTDTILPTQTLSQPSKLVSRYTETNYSSGRFQFVLQEDGHLSLYTTKFPLDSVNFAYLTTQIFGNGFELFFNKSGSIYVRASNGSIISMVLNSSSSQDFYQRAILEHDGVFRQYLYPKGNSSSVQRWPMAWSVVSFIPSNICSIVENIGSGACGFNSYCMQDQRPSCQCPLGYTFINPDDVLKGCKQNFVSQSCDEATPETHLFGFHEMQNTNWPNSDYANFQGVTEDWCRKACLSDCFCSVAIYNGGQCWMKKTPLSNGVSDASVSGKALIKIRKDNSTLTPNGTNKKERSTLIIIGSVLLGSSGLLNFLLLGVTFLGVFHFKFKKSEVIQPFPTAGITLRSFTYEELRKATNGFEEEIGRGAFATVYKGVLLDNNKNLIAVKNLNDSVKEGDREFKAEVSAIGRTNHRNLVQLLGFCNEGKHRLVVYEFMCNGSLASFLFTNPRPNWYQRIQIALGTARGLLYLHEECSTQIIHCDIKPQNVLIDDSCVARISDFGLAKLLKTDQTRTTTAIRGTKGYVAPEWFRSMPITVKVDVYSYGILLLELISCRRSFEAEAENEDQMVLTDWTYDCFRDKKLSLMVENDDVAREDMKKVEKYVMIAIWCIQEDPSLRPTMKKVLQMLEGAIDVPIPPDPTSFMSSI
ncbi:Receptor-like protein kinase [Quillaja saponaria]|uniref:Receptor-like serine/threonine-protein kinase n=1 Tax=Quillaja saponaria TaxID=32244 RepID=A0AAD7PGP9_QUISA|nr:Receptor-like protein kinase [Quillaja saponaria]